MNKHRRLFAVKTCAADVRELLYWKREDDHVLTKVNFAEKRRRILKILQKLKHLHIIYSLYRLNYALPGESSFIN